MTNASPQFDALVEQAKRKAQLAAAFVRTGFAVAAEWPFPDCNVLSTPVQRMSPAFLKAERAAASVRIGFAVAVEWPFPDPTIIATPTFEMQAVQQETVSRDDIDLSDFELLPATARDHFENMAARDFSIREQTGRSPDVASAPAWVAPGETQQIAGIDLPDGMIYLGAGGRHAAALADAGVIDPGAPVNLSFASLGNAGMGYAPHYSAISPEARGGYLQWLGSGRRDPRADIGYVFLFFYGLERRALIERKLMLASSGEREAIIAEVEQLLDVYCASQSFERYATTFLLYLGSLAPDWRAYNQAPGTYSANGFVPLSIALALGQFAADEIALPPEWALRWVRGDHNISKRTAATRCVAQFDALFMVRYQQQFPEGYVLGINKTALKIFHYPASPAYREKAFALAIDNLPDVTMLVRHLDTLQSLVDACEKELDAYSRALGRAASKPLSCATDMLLPCDVWPPALASKLNAVSGSIVADFHLVAADALLAHTGMPSPYLKDDLAAVTSALAAIGVAMEPALAVATKAGKSFGKICLFRIAPGKPEISFPPAYDTAKVALSLASVVAAVDGAALPADTAYLLAQTEAWPDLTDVQRQRLRAHLHVVLDQPPSLQAATKRLAGSMPDSAREICHLLCSLALADGTVTADERAMLQKIYAALSLSPSRVDADLADLGCPRSELEGKRNAVAHGAGAVGAAGAAAVPLLVLDATRVAQILRETEQVSRMLAQVFDAEPEPAVAPDPIAPSADPLTDTALVMGLDAVHSAIVRQLLTRTRWPRHELQSMVSDAGLMLSGALERINDACFDHLDWALVEGEDPIEVYLDLREQIL